MAHFRGTLQGSRGEASRLGTKGSDLIVTADGWNFGVVVTLSYNSELDEDEAFITLTSGSDGGPTRFLGKYRKGDLQK